MNYKVLTVAVFMIISLCLVALSFSSSFGFIGFMVCIMPFIMVYYVYSVLRSPEQPEKDLEDGWFENH